MPKDQPDQHKGSKPQKDMDWENRVLCSDGNCIGIIGLDGRCKECSKPYEGKLPWQIKSVPIEPDPEAVPTEDSRSFEDKPATEVADNIDEKSHEENDWENRPGDNVWNVPVDTLPVDASSSAYIATIGADRPVHPDFGSGTWKGEPIGIPYATVPGNQPKVAVTFDYDDESDPGPYPIPTDAPIEGGPGSSGDRHVLVLERDSCILYEMFDAHPQVDGSWQAGSGAVFDLNSNELRPAGWTSADAAGLPILAGLVRYDEVATGEITHALRFTAPQTRDGYIWPARHEASDLTGMQYPPMGQRFRLKADVDISGFSPEVQVILRAMKKYGIILADNGSAWFVSGVTDERWDNDDLHDLHQLHGSDFEAVDESMLMIDPDSGQVRIFGHRVYLPLVLK